jgi:hypothetical protein
MHMHSVTNIDTRGSAFGTKSGGVGSVLEHQSLRMVCPNCDTKRSGPCGHHQIQTKITPR